MVRLPSRRQSTLTVGLTGLIVGWLVPVLNRNSLTGLRLCVTSHMVYLFSCVLRLKHAMDFSRIRVRFRCASDGMLRYVRQRADGDVALGYQ